MYTDDFGDVLTILPPIEEQNRMVQYLDEQTSRIDEAIAQQQRMIDLLNERKQIIINNAVTKGLDPHVTMKDCGVEYIGEMPSSWDIVPLKFLGTTKKQLVSPKSLKGQTVCEYSMSAFDDDKKPEIVNANELDSSKILITDSVLLVNKLNVHKRRIWFVFNPSHISVASTEFVPFHIEYANPKYIEFALQSNRLTNHLMCNSNGATNSQKRASPSVIENVKIPIPPTKEQHSIVNFLEKEIDILHKRKELCNKTISFLLERKKIIINDVVTGKIKV